MKTMRRKMIAVIVAMALLTQLVSAMYVEAATKKTTKATSNASYVTIVNRNGGLAGIPAKTRKNIKTKITRWEMARILKNLYDGRINLAAAYIDGATLTQAWACSMLTSASSQLGCKVTWGGGSPNAKVDLGTACKLIVLTINQSAKLRPTKWS